MGGHRHASKRPTRIVDPKLPQAILETERVLKEDKPVCNTGDDITLEFHEDGYPKLPACLDRRPFPALAEAA
jgi:hypothetical protein